MVDSAAPRQLRFSNLTALALVAAIAATAFYLLPSPLLTFAACAVAYLATAIASLRFFGLADYRPLIVLTSGLYAFTGPIWVIVMGNDQQFSPDLMARSLLCSVLYILVLALAATTLAKPEAKHFDRPTRMGTLWVGVGGVFVAYLGLNLLGILTGGTQSRADQVSGGSALIGILTYAVFTGVVILFAIMRDQIQAILFRDRRAVDAGPGNILPTVTVLVMAALVILSQVVLAGNRREVLGFMAALFVVVRPPRLPWWMIALVVVTATFAFYLPWLREAPISQWFDLLVNFEAYFGSVELSNSEFMPFSMIAEILFSVHDISDAPSYLDAFGTFVPRPIWPGRPMPVAEWFVASFFPDIHNVGGGLAFNAVMESVLNFGYAGVIVVPILLASILEVVNRWFATYRLGSAAILIASLFLMRQDFATTLKGGAIILALIFFWLMLAGVRPSPQR